MATKTINIPGFSLKSSWSYKTKTYDSNGWVHFSNPVVSTASKTVNVDLSSIPAGSRVTSATFAGEASYGSSRAISNGVNVNVDDVQDVTRWFTSLSSSISIQFTFQYSGYIEPIIQQREPSSPTGSRTSTFRDLVLTINYELPSSTGKLNKTTVPADGSSSITLTITPTNNTYRHKAIWYLSSNRGKTDSLAAGTVTSTWAVPTNCIDAIPDAASKQAKVTLETYKPGSTWTSSDLLGSVTYTFTITVPTSVKPSVNIQTGTLTWTNPNNDTFSGELVQGLSTARLRLKISDVNAGTGSTIKSVVFSGWGGTKTATKGETYYYADLGVLKSSGYKTIKVVITDNRGRTYEFDSSTIDAHFFPVRTYNEPTINGVSVKRCSDANGETLDDTGSYMRILVDYTYWRINNENGNALNSATIRATYKITGQSQTTTVDLTKPTEVKAGNVRNVGNGAKKVVSISTDRGYDVTITLTDALGKSSTATQSILTATYVLHFRNGGNAVGIGQAAGSANSLTVNPEWNFNMYGGPVNEHSVYKGQITASQSERKDFNNYTQYGYYSVHSASVPYIDNCPVNSTAGTLIVMTACDNEKSTTVVPTSTYWSAIQIYITTNGSIYKRYIKTTDTAGAIVVPTQWGKLMSTDDTLSISSTTGTLGTDRGGTGLSAANLNALKTSLGIAFGIGSSITFPADTVFPGILTSSNGSIRITFNLGRQLIGNLKATISGSGWLLTSSGKTNNDPLSINNMGTITTSCDPSGIVDLLIGGSFNGNNNTPVSFVSSTPITIAFTAAS